MDVHLDEDLLQAFSGEYVTVTLPASRPSLLGAQESVTALRCAKPDRIRELLHRLVERLQQIPAVKAQQLQLKPSAVEGFEELSANILMAFGARPVIGFHEGWLMMASTPEALQKILKARQGEGQNITETDRFQQFQLAIEGPVHGISYTNLAESTRQAAMVLRQVGTLLPTLFAMAGAEADAEKLEPVQDILALLPSVADIVEKFDFLEAQLSVTQEGAEPGSYQRRAVTLVRSGQPDQ